MIRSSTVEFKQTVHRQRSRHRCAQFTGRRFLGSFSDDEAQYRALLEAGVAFAQTYQLKPGIALTGAQMAQLTSDIVWLVERTVQLPDGRSQRVLVPQLYALVDRKTGTLQPGLISAKGMTIKLSDGLFNSGTLAARENLAINAGSGTVNRNVGGDALIEGTVIRGGQVNPLTAGGTVTAVAAVDTRHVEDSVFSSTIRWQSTKSNGSIEQTLHMPEIHGQIPQGVSPYQGAGGVSVQLPAGSNVRTAIETLSQEPGKGYLNALGERSDIDWQRVEALSKSLDFSKSGLTQEATIVVIIVVSILTYGAASSAGGAAATATGSSAVGAAVTAGTTSLASTAAVSLINNKGDIGATLKELGSEDNVKGLLLTMATAGLTQGLLGSIQLEGGGTLASVDANSSMGQLLAKNAVQGISSAVLESAVMGTSLEDAIKANLQGALINTLAAKGADAIGDAKLDATSKALAHALLGCAMGTANAGSSAGCAPGATGAVIGEIVAALYGDSQDLGGLEDKLKNDPSNEALKQQIAQIRNTVTELAKLTGAGGALLIGGDAGAMQIAMGTAQNAAVNNYLNHNKPSLMGLSEVEQYERAVSECGPSNPGACALRDELAQRSAARDHALKDACSGPSASQPACNFQAQQAIAMGNVVTGSYGGLAYANSTNGAIGLNTATVGPVTRPDNFRDNLSQSTAEALALAAGGQGASIVRLSGAGFALGSGFDAAGQFVQNGSVRPVQSVVAGLTGAAGLPLALRGGVYTTAATGAAVVGANTTFNNFYYGENTNVWFAAGLGAVASVAGPYAGRYVGSAVAPWVTNAPRIPMTGAAYIPIQSRWPTMPGYIGAATGNTVGNLPSFIPLNNGNTPGSKP
jgi:hypothetical protein